MQPALALFNHNRSLNAIVSRSLCTFLQIMHLDSQLKRRKKEIEHYHLTKQQIALYAKRIKKLEAEDKRLVSEIALSKIEATDDKENQNQPLTA
jgi:hypothetical protein